METSTNYNFNLPNSANDEIADINDISDNFRIIDEIMKETDQTFSGTSENPQSGTAIAGVLSGYVPAEVGKGLSSNDFTNEDKKKLYSALQDEDIDQIYNPESTNPQSGTAVAEAVSNKVDKETGKGLSSNDYTNEEKEKLAGIEAGAEVNAPIDTTYNPESANAQSGIAVAQAVDTCSPAIVTTSDTGKALSIPDSSESVIKGLTAYGESTQDGTPTPDSPVEIVSIENPVISVYGKNLFDKNNANIIVAYPDVENAINPAPTTRSVYIPCMPNTTYTVSKVVTARFAVAFTDVLPARGVAVTGRVQNNTATSITSTSGANSRYIVVWIYHSNYDTSITIGEVLATLQIELGSVATPYEPYIELQTVTLPYTFRGLKNTTTGQWSARDELRVGDGKVEIVRNIQTYTFTGQESIKEYTYGNDLDTYTRHFNFVRLFGDGNNPPKKTPVLNEKFISGGAMNALDASFLTTEYNASAYHLYAQISKQLFSDSSTNYTEQLAQMLQGTNLYAVNPNPTVEDITSTEAGQALLALKTNYPNTSVISDIDLNLTYRADTKNYIDNKFAALTALTLEG